MAQSTDLQTFPAKAVPRLFWSLLVLALGGLAIILLGGPMSVRLPFPGESLGQLLHFRFDVLTTVLFVMVSLLFSCVARFSRSYLAGEPAYGSFFNRMLVLYLATGFFIFSQNLLMIFASWVAMSFALHSLLLFYPQRPRAQAAAKKKFFVSRLGDLFLLTALALLYREFGSLDLTVLIEQVRSLEPAVETSALPLVGLLIAAGALIKSAQVPFHFWLPESMETPTPVSALMHAGIINAGGVLLIRLAPLMEQAPGASVLVAVTGALSAVYGALVMMTQNDIKKKLAYSTISQMGLMMFACGLGAPSLALVHIIAHSLYKAHGFLTTGSLVGESKKVAWKVAPRGWVSAALPPALGVGLLLWASVFHGDQLNLVVYACVLLLGVFESPVLGSPWRARRLSQLAILLLLVAAIALAVEIETVVERVLSATATARHLDGAIGLALVWVCYFIFASGFLLAWFLRDNRGPAREKLYMVLWNGGYFSQLTTRFFKSFQNPRSPVALGKEA